MNPTVDISLDPHPALPIQLPTEPTPLLQLTTLVQQQMQQQNQQAQQIQQLDELVQKQIQHEAAVVSTSRSRSPPPVVKPAKPNTFAGGRKNNARTWISEMERYLAFMKVPAHEVVPFVATHFRDAASVWYDNICQQEAHKTDMQNWHAFKQLFLDNFQPVEASRTARSTLYHLKQRGSVADYCDVFRSYLNQINKMEIDDQIFLFLNGLNPTIAKEVNMQQPKTLAQAMSIAQRADVEGRMYSNQTRRAWHANPPYRFNPPTFPGPTMNVPMAAPVPMELGNIQHEDVYEQEPVEQPNMERQNQLFVMQRPRQNVSREQLEQMKQKGLCFRCGLPGHVARNCSSMQQQVSQRYASGTPDTSTRSKNMQRQQ
jgi:hypothetical protein